jgi:hypothetical protein
MNIPISLKAIYQTKKAPSIKEEACLFEKLKPVGQPGIPMLDY